MRWWIPTTPERRATTYWEQRPCKQAPMTHHSYRDCAAASRRTGTARICRWRRGHVHPWIGGLWLIPRILIVVTRLMPDFVSNFVAMTTRIAPLNIWLTSLDCLSLRTPSQTHASRWYLYTRRVIGDFVLNFVAMATGLVVVQFDWHQSIAHPWIPPTECKRQSNIFYTRVVIDFFASNFVAMATGAGPLKLWLT